MIAEDAIKAIKNGYKLTNGNGLTMFQDGTFTIVNGTGFHISGEVVETGEDNDILIKTVIRIGNGRVNYPLCIMNADAWTVRE